MSLTEKDFPYGFHFIVPGDARHSEFHGYSEAITVYIGIGSNQGDRLANIERAIKWISSFGEILKESTIVETEPVVFSCCRKSTEML